MRFLMGCRTYFDRRRYELTPGRNKVLTRTIIDRSKSNAPANDHFTWATGGLICRRKFQVTARDATLVEKTGERLRLEFLEFCEKIVATTYFVTVFEADDVRLS